MTDYCSGFYTRKGRPGPARGLPSGRVCRVLHPNPDREVYAEACAGCATSLTSAGQPGVHACDHIGLPPVTTRVQLHSGACPGCGERVAAAAPAVMPLGSPSGPGIVALVVYLPACQLVSFNRLVEMPKVCSA